MTDPVTVTIGEAARILGVGEQTIRRRIKRGELTAVRVERPQGHQWQVVIDQVVTRSPDQVTADADQVTGSQDLVNPLGPDQVTASLRLAQDLTAQLEQERARSAQLEQERAELYGRLGYFQAQLEQAQTQIKALAAPKEPVPGGNAVLPPAEPPKRPWWAFWR